MKKYLLALLCCASLSASQFEHTITITPSQTSESGKKVYLAEIKIMKMFADGSPFVVATPTLVCVEGEKAEVKVGSQEEGNLLIVSVLVPENNTEEAETSIYLTEGTQVMISEEKMVKIIKSARTWAERRQQLLHTKL